MKQKLGWKFLINPSFLKSNFFSKCSKKFSIGYMIMFKVCKRCLQPCSLRQKKNYGRTISTSKYIQKSWPPLTPLRGGGQQLQRNFNLILRDLVKNKTITKTLSIIRRAVLFCFQSNTSISQKRRLFTFKVSPREIFHLFLETRN